ncbi:MAG: FtsX-like permease family protein [Balneolaceae bacterium]|nr:FtsX-like permease family protein [Balneolaceae bacterium]
MAGQNLINGIFDRILPPELHHLIGDLEEEFHNNAKREGLGYARRRFWSQVLRSLPYFIFQSLIWNVEMLYNYLKVSWRNLKKHTGFSLINVLGLAASMSVCLLIILFIADQLNYDRFHPKTDQIVRVITDLKSQYSDGSTGYATSPGTLGDLLKENYPEVEAVSRVQGDFEAELRYNKKTMPLEGIHADENFLHIFGFELLQGNPETALSEPGNILLTPEVAKTLFGEKNPLGETVIGLEDRDYTVTGVIKNDYQTHINFEAVVSYQTLVATTRHNERLQDWKRSVFSSYNYFLMKEGADLEHFEEQIQSVIELNYHDPSEENVIGSFVVQPLTDINMGPALSNEIGMVMPGFIVWFLAGFAFIIMLVASFNYVSLTVARSLNRGKEVGVRKVLGAHRGSVVKQFLLESVLISFIALLFSSVLLRWLLPEFNSLFFISFTNYQIEPGLISNPGIILSFLIFSIVIGILAGIYPSRYLSSFSPAQVLKGTFNSNRMSGQKLKKILTVAQFSFSLIFIITSMILFQQFSYMGNTDYGFNREHIVNIALQDVPYDQLEFELAQSSNVVSMAASSKVPALGSIDGVWIKSDLNENRVNAHSFRVDENYIQTMGINLLAGRNFNPDMATDTSTAVIISDQAVRQLGFKNFNEALNSEITVNKQSYSVVGIVKNFISADPSRAGDPIVFLYQPDNVYYAVVKLQAGKTEEFINELEKTWSSLNSLYGVKYRIFNDQIKETPSLVVFIDFIKILFLLGAFSILISCLGLLGMAMYSAENRVKEIGVRKVLGATVQNIVVLLSKEYLVLLGIAIAIGLPVTWFINKLWMDAVTNKVGLHPVVFIGGTLLIFGLALLTVGSQALRAARANSIDNLRSE